jgi:hypothetical protein
MYAQKLMLAPHTSVVFEEIPAETKNVTVELELITSGIPVPSAWKREDAAGVARIVFPAMGEMHDAYRVKVWWT